MAVREFAIPALLPDSLECAECAHRLGDSLGTLHGVEGVVVDTGAGRVTVTYDPEVIDVELLVEAAERAGVAVASQLEHTAYAISGLDCPDCAAGIEKTVAAVPGVTSASLNFASATMVLEWDPEHDPRAEVETLVRRMGHGIEALAPAGEVRAAVPEPVRWEAGDYLTAVAGILILAGWAARLLDATALAQWGFAAAVALGLFRTGRRALVSVTARNVDMNVLITVAVLGAAALGEWGEAAVVLFLYHVGLALENRSLARTRRAISALLSLTPNKATVVREGAEVEIDVAAIAPGDELIVRPGERVPVDAEVIHGETAVDESAITGESVPAEKAPGERIFSGSLNTTGLIRVRALAPASGSAVARIVSMVEEAQARKAPAERAMDRFSRHYTPAAIGAAAAVAVLPPLLGPLLGFNPGAWADWLYRGLVVLVVACPCALVISTPVSIVSGITACSRRGVLVKGGVFLERAARLDAVALDKTGTLSRGRPRLERLVLLDGGFSERDALAVAGALEAGSRHPLARAIVEAADEEADRRRVESLHELPGVGVKGRVDGEEFLVGSVKAAREQGVPYHSVADAVGRLEEDGLTPVVLASGSRAVAVFGLGDPIREGVPEALSRLRRAGMRHVVMLTGDSEAAAGRIADAAGISDVRARLLPEEKTDFIAELRERYGGIVMVGDGINDAPALAAADIGVAMGLGGSDMAVETADVTLVRDDLSALADFVLVGRSTMRNIAQNVTFAVVVKFAVLALAVLGKATMWMAVFADTGVALLVILNALRLLRPRREAG
ncbi:MAG: heavy metal translocating P-type ATPase [Coriobacteriia bacterium]